MLYLYLFVSGSDGIIWDILLHLVRFNITLACVHVSN